MSSISDQLVSIRAMEEFIRRFKELRKERNLTLKQIGDSINATESCVSRWERGERIPNIVSLKALAIYFGVSSDYLLGIADD